MTDWFVKAETGLADIVRMRSERAAYVSVAEARRQEATVRRVLAIFAAGPMALIADDVGMGKTYEALAVAALALAFGKRRLVYIVTPGKPVRRKWEDDLYQFTEGNVLDEEVRDQLRRAQRSYLLRGDREDGSSDVDEQSVAHREYMRRLVTEANEAKEFGGIVFLHRSMLVGKVRDAERDYFVTRGLRACGRREPTIKPLMKRWGLTMNEEPPVWLADSEASNDRLDVDKAVERGIEIDDHSVIHRATRNAVLRETLPPADLLIVDEAHGLTSPGYRKAIRAALRPRVDKVLLLSATPFQTEPEQLEHLIQVARNGTVPDGLEGAGMVLRAYVGARERLREIWNELADHELIAGREALESDEPAVGVIARLRAAAAETRAARADAAALLQRFVIRSVRREKAECRQLKLGDPAAPVRGRIDDDTLVDRRGTGVDSGDDEVLILAIERLLSELRAADDRTFVAQIRQNATSSYAALLTWIAEGLRRGETGEPRFHRTPRNELSPDPGYYAQLVHDLVESRDDRDREHPKVEAVATEVACGAVAGHKTLVFCARAATVGKIVAAANQQLDEQLHRTYGAARSRDEFERARRSLMEDLRHDARRLSVLLRENPIHTVLPRLLGMPCLPAAVREVDDAFIADVRSALANQGGGAESVIHACAREVLLRIERGPWGARASARRRSLSESDSAVLTSLQAAIPPGELAGARATKRPPGEESLTRICRHLVWGPDFFGPIAGLLATLSTNERRHAITALRLAVATPVTLSPLVEPYLLGDDQLLERMAEVLQPVALAASQRFERLLSPGLGNRAKRLEYAAVAYERSKAVVALESDDETEERRQLLFNAPFYPLAVVATARFGQGIDLHRECSRVIHHDGHWNPAVIEQRTGRIDRIHSRTSRLREHGHAAQLEIYHPFIAGTVDEQILLRSFERASWYDALLGGKDVVAPVKEGDAGDEDGLLTAERRFPFRAAQELAIDLSPPEPNGDATSMVRGVDASPWPADGTHGASTRAAWAERLLRSLAYEGFAITRDDHDALIIEGIAGVSSLVTIRATVSADALTLGSEGGRSRTWSLRDLVTDVDVYERFHEAFLDEALRSVGSPNEVQP